MGHYPASAIYLEKQTHNTAVLKHGHMVPSEPQCNSLVELVERLVSSSCTLVMEQAWVRLLQLLPWFSEELDLDRPLEMGVTSDTWLIDPWIDLLFERLRAFR